MVSHVSIMVGANLVALVVMLMAATPIAEFVDQHPTIKILALAFLVLIGTNLVAEGLVAPEEAGRTPGGKAGQTGTGHLDAGGEGLHD